MTFVDVPVDNQLEVRPNQARGGLARMRHVPSEQWQPIQTGNPEDDNGLYRRALYSAWLKFFE